MRAVTAARITSLSPSSFWRFVSAEWKNSTLWESALPVLSGNCQCWLSWALVLQHLDQVHGFRGWWHRTRELPLLQRHELSSCWQAVLGKAKETEFPQNKACFSVAIATSAGRKLYVMHQWLSAWATNLLGSFDYNLIFIYACKSFLIPLMLGKNHRAGHQASRIVELGEEDCLLRALLPCLPAFLEVGWY